MSLRIVFAGTPEFATYALEALHDSEHQVVAVYTQPDRPAGRGKKLTESAVKKVALQYDLPLYQPETLKDISVQQVLREHDAEIMVDVAYGLFIPKAVLEMFQYGCVNIHPSLLPRWRGAAPIQRAILSGDAEIGVTIMQVDEGWDTGDILAQCQMNLVGAQPCPRPTAGELTTQLAKIGAELLLTTIDNLVNGNIKPIPQDSLLIEPTYADKITKDEALLDWNLSAIELARAVRAYNPWPVAFTKIEDTVVRIWQAELIDGVTKESPGTIIHSDKKGIDVATGNGILRLLELQLAGGKRLAAVDVLNSRKLLFAPGKMFYA